MNQEEEIYTILNMKNFIENETDKCSIIISFYELIF